MRRPRPARFSDRCIRTGRPMSASRRKLSRRSSKCSYTHLQPWGLSQSDSGNSGASSERNRWPSSAATAPQDFSARARRATPWNNFLTPTVFLTAAVAGFGLSARFRLKSINRSTYVPYLQFNPLYSLHWARTGAAAGNRLNIE